MPLHNKLVRDYIPEIINKTGKNYRTRQLSEEEYMDALREKMREETNELMSAWSREEIIEEAADLLEVLHALAAANETTIEEMEKARRQKKLERGGFEDRIYLIEVEDD